MRVLITNDDGINAPGLAAIEKIARKISDDVWIVAPKEEQSGVGRSITLHRPLRLNYFGENRYSVAGTPADCIIMAVREILADKLPDIVLSGVNHGANIADDCLYSGTIGAALEASQYGIRSFALSQAVAFRSPDEVVHWDTAIKFAPQLINKLYETKSDTSIIYNLNFPNCSPENVNGFEVTHTGRYADAAFGLDKREDACMREYYWVNFRQRGALKDEKSDIQAIRDNKVSITPLKRDLSAKEEMDNITELLK